MARMRVLDQEARMLTRCVNVLHGLGIARDDAASVEGKKWWSDK